MLLIKNLTFTLYTSCILKTESGSCFVFYYRMKNCNYQTAFRNPVKLHIQRFKYQVLNLIFNFYFSTKRCQSFTVLSSIESDTENVDINQDQRRRMENYLWWRRKGVLIIILVFFVLTATVLSFSVFYDQSIRVIVSNNFLLVRYEI